MLVHIVADYGHGDLAFSEVIQRIRIHLPDAELVLTPVPAFSTLAAGFCIAQLGLNEAPPGTLIYHNVAPRADDAEARPGNAGERLSYARLSTGVRVIGIHAGHTLSFIRDEAEKLRWAATPAEGSQFRSRDLFPQAAAAIALGVAGHSVRRSMLRPSRTSLCIGLRTSTGMGTSRLRSGVIQPGCTPLPRIGSTSGASLARPLPATGPSPCRRDRWRLPLAAADGGRNALGRCAGWRCSCEAGTRGRSSDVRRSALRSESINSEVGDWLAAESELRQRRDAGRPAERKDERA